MVQGIVQRLRWLTCLSRLSRLSWLTLFAVLAAGCSPGRSGPATGDVGEGDMLPAVRSLMVSSQAAFAEGDFEAAAADLERALRLQPREPGLWYELARVRQAQAKYAEAESMAHRSNSLSAGDASLERRNWELIEQSRLARGDEPGAREARSHIDG